MRKVNGTPMEQAAGPGFVKSQTTDAALTQLRRSQIVAAAIKLFSKNGFYRTTVHDIARKAKVSSGLIYHYARTKEDILLLSLMSVLEGYKQELPPAIAQAEDPLDRLFACLKAYCSVVDESREATVLAYRSTRSLPENQRELVKQLEVQTNQMIERCLQDCIDAGYFRNVDAQLTTYHLVSFAHTWALKHWRLASLTTQEEYLRQGFDFFVRALVTPKGWKRYLKSIRTDARATERTDSRESV